MLPEEQLLMIEHPISDLPDKNPFECESRYCTLINNVNIGSYRNTPGSGRYILVNPAMPRIFGYDSVAEFMQIAVVDLYRNPEDRNSIMEEVKRNSSVKNRELPMKRKDGTPIWCSVTISAEFDEAGEIKWMDGVVEEITGRRRILQEQQSAIEELEGRVRERLADLVETNKLLTAEIAERKRFEEKLREQYQFLEVLINAIPGPVFYKDAGGIYQGCNWAFEKYMGLSRERIVGKTDYDFAPRKLAEKYRTIDQSLMANPGIQDYETIFQDADGRELNVIIIKAAYLKNKGEVGGVIGIMVDVTDIRKLEEEQLKMEKLESLGLLAGGIAHDFNNLITGILGNISLARIFLDPLHKSTRHLEEAEKASQRAAELAHQLLTFARGGSPIKKRVAIRKIVDETVSFSLRGSNVEGIVAIPDSLNAVEADEGQLRQAFGNIILNAMQAMPGGGTLKISAEDITLSENNVFSLSPGKYVKISFSDQGSGISEENRKKIFDPYFTTKAGGTGLGLSSTYSIIKRHGGCIDLHSSVGEGTTFICYVPSTGETITGHHSVEGPFEVVEHRGGSVLVMDDEEMIRAIVAEMLEYLGYQASTCKTGEDAIALYKAAKESGSPFFAVIMDLTIPGGMGGKDAARQILTFDPSARLIVSSGYSDNPVMADYEKFGFCGAVIKPYEAMEISNVLSNVRKITSNNTV
jgi:two-component system cell cycle sensor histidine kinase/response regulator CckA